jgi:predicted PurR-regulated permease PerM
VTTTRSPWALRLSVLYFAASAAALVWPIYPWLGNRIEPRVFGLPFSLVWVLGVIVCNFGVLALLYGLRLIDATEPDAPDRAEASS